MSAAYLYERRDAVSGANFDSFVVWCPNDPEGVHDGSFHPVKVLALDHQDAIHKAISEWSGRSFDEGTYIVCREDDLTGYEIEQETRPSVTSQVSLPLYPKATA